MSSATPSSNAAGAAAVVVTSDSSSSLSHPGAPVRLRRVSGRLSRRRRLCARWELEEVVDRGGELHQPPHLPAWPLSAVADKLFERSAASVSTNALSSSAWCMRPFPHEEMGFETLFDRVNYPETVDGKMMVMVLPSDLQDAKLDECVHQNVGNIKKKEMEMLRSNGFVFLRQAYRTTYCICRDLEALKREFLASPAKGGNGVAAYILPVDICAEPAERPRPPAEQLVALVEHIGDGPGIPMDKRARIVQLEALDAAITGRQDSFNDVRSVACKSLDPRSTLSPLRSSYEIDEAQLEKELKNLMRHYPALHSRHPVPVLLVPPDVNMQRQQHFVPVRSFKVMHALAGEHDVLCEDRSVLPPVELVLRNFVSGSALWLAVPASPDKAWNGFSLQQASSSVAALWANELTAASIVWAEMHSKACLGLDRSDVWATKNELMKAVTARFRLDTPGDELQAAWFVLSNVLKRHVVGYAQTVALQARRQKRPAPDTPITKVPDFMPSVVLRPCDLPLPGVPGIDLVRRPEQLLSPAIQLQHRMFEESVKRGQANPPYPLSRILACVDAVLNESVPPMLDRGFNSLRDALGFNGPPDAKDEDGEKRGDSNDEDDEGSSICWSVDDDGVHLA